MRGENAAMDFAQCGVVVLASGVYGGGAHKNIFNLIGSGGMDTLPPDAKI